MNALMRNLGASIGVATLVALLDRNIQINRSVLSEHLTPFSPLWRLATTPIENGIPVDRARIISYLMPFGGGWPFGSVPIDDPSQADRHMEPRSSTARPRRSPISTISACWRSPP